MPTNFREVCPVEGCEGWQGTRRKTGVENYDEDQSVADGVALHAHLGLEHPEVEPSLLWATYEAYEAPDWARAARWLAVGALLTASWLAVRALLRATTR